MAVNQYRFAISATSQGEMTTVIVTVWVLILEPLNVSDINQHLHRFTLILLVSHVMHAR